MLYMAGFDQNDPNNPPYSLQETSLFKAFDDPAMYIVDFMVIMNDDQTLVKRHISDPDTFSPIMITQADGIMKKMWKEKKKRIITMGKNVDTCYSKKILNGRYEIITKDHQYNLCCEILEDGLFKRELMI